MSGEGWGRAIRVGCKNEGSFGDNEGGVSIAQRIEMSVSGYCKMEQKVLKNFQSYNGVGVRALRFCVALLLSIVFFCSRAAAQPMPGPYNLDPAVNVAIHQAAASSWRSAIGTGFSMLAHPFLYNASAAMGWTTGYGGAYAKSVDDAQTERDFAIQDAQGWGGDKTLAFNVCSTVGVDIEQARIAFWGSDMFGQRGYSTFGRGGALFLAAASLPLKPLKAACAGVKASKAAVKPAVVAAGVKGACAKVVQSVRSCGLSKDLSDHVKGKFHGSFPAGKAKGCVPLLSAGGHIHDPSDPTTITGWIQKILQTADGQYRVPQSNITCAKQLLRNHFGIDDTVTDFDGLIANATKNVTKPGQHGCINLVLPKERMTNKCWENTKMYAASLGAATNTSSSGYVVGCKTIFPKDYDYDAALRHILSDPLSITDPGGRWIEGVYSGVRTKGFAAGGTINTGFPTFCQ